MRDWEHHDDACIVGQRAGGSQHNAGKRAGLQILPGLIPNHQKRFGRQNLVYVTADDVRRELNGATTVGTEQWRADQACVALRRNQAGGGEPVPRLRR